MKNKEEKENKQFYEKKTKKNFNDQKKGFDQMLRVSEQCDKRNCQIFPLKPVNDGCFKKTVCALTSEVNGNKPNKECCDSGNNEFYKLYGNCNEFGRFNKESHSNCNEPGRFHHQSKGLSFRKNSSVDQKFVNLIWENVKIKFKISNDFIGENFNSLKTNFLKKFGENFILKRENKKIHLELQSNNLLKSLELVYSLMKESSGKVLKSSNLKKYKPFHIVENSNFIKKVENMTDIQSSGIKIRNSYYEELTVNTEDGICLGCYEQVTEDSNNPTECNEFNNKMPCDINNKNCSIKEFNNKMICDCTMSNNPNTNDNTNYQYNKPFENIQMPIYNNTISQELFQNDSQDNNTANNNFNFPQFFNVHSSSLNKEYEKLFQTDNSTISESLSMPCLLKTSSFSCLNFLLMKILHFQKFQDLLELFSCTDESTYMEPFVFIINGPSVQNANSCLKQIQELYYTNLLVHLNETIEDDSDIKFNKNNSNRPIINEKHNSTIEATDINSFSQQDKHTSSLNSLKFGNNESIDQANNQTLYQFIEGDTQDINFKKSEATIASNIESKYLNSSVYHSPPYNGNFNDTSQHQLPDKENKTHKSSVQLHGNFSYISITGKNSTNFLFSELKNSNFIKGTKAFISLKVENEIGDFICGKKLGKLFKMNCPCLKVFVTSLSNTSEEIRSNFKMPENDNTDFNDYEKINFYKVFEDSVYETEEQSIFSFEMEGNISECLRCYSNILDEFPSEILFFVDSKHHKKIIGAGGFAIQKIMKKYNVYIKFFNDKDSEELLGNVLIKTPRKNKDQMVFAKAEILNIVGVSEKEQPVESQKIESVSPFKTIEDLLEMNLKKNQI